MGISEEIKQTLEDPMGLIERYQVTKDIEIRNELILHYSYIARAVAAQMRGITSNYAQMEDITNEGIITLIDCIEKYDLSKGVKFESYAFMRVKCANIDFIRKQDWLPRRVRKTAKDISAAYDTLSNELMREPTVKELAQHMKMPEQVLNKHYSEISNSVMLSFETIIQNSLQGTSTIDFSLNEDLLPEGSVFKQELRSQLMEAIDALSERERLVISLYYYEHLKLFEIAEILGVSESRVCQVHSKAIIKLKSKMEHYMKG